MATSIETPTGTPFNFEIDTNRRTINITSQNGNNHGYKIEALKDLYVWLKNNHNEDWVYLGSRGEEETPNDRSVEEWARSDNNPVGGFYGVTPGRRGRFASYIPSILEYLGFVAIEHNKINNRVKAL